MSRSHFHQKTPKTPAYNNRSYRPRALASTRVFEGSHQGCTNSTQIGCISNVLDKIRHRKAHPGARRPTSPPLASSPNHSASASTKVFITTTTKPPRLQRWPVAGQDNAGNSHTQGYATTETNTKPDFERPPESSRDESAASKKKTVKAAEVQSKLL
jgi:hypothetical protein